MEGELARMFGVSERAPLLGEVHCIGMETELLECSHTSIGRHLCGVTIVPPVPDIVITCSGMTEVVLYTLLLCCVLLIELFGNRCRYSMLWDNIVNVPRQLLYLPQKHYAVLPL